MKKKIRKNIVLLFVIGFFISSLLILNTNADSTVVYEKGELRCPTVLDKNTTCVPKYTDGKVTSVELTYEDTNIVVKKIVTKKQTVGKYDVEFRVKGKSEEQIMTAQPAYVLVAIDMSKTIKGNISNMKKAVEAFGQALIPDNTQKSNFYLGLLQFATNVSVRQEFTNQNFNDLKYLGYNNSKIGKKSHVEKAYSKAKSLFSSVPSNANKYLFIFGDGRYWSNEDTDTSKVVKNANALKNSGVTVFGARYKGSYPNDKMGKLNSAIRLGCKEGQKYNTCDEIVMKKIVSKYYPPASTSTWIDLFKEIANDIKSTVGTQSVDYFAELEDDIGKDFSITEDGTKNKKFDVGKLTTSEKVFGPFEIEIDPETGRGWHETNENVYLTYTTKDGEKKYTIQNNPEVYWINDNLNIYSCTGDAKKETQEKEDYPYYSKECSDDYKVRISVDNAAEGQKSFSLLNGRGFPTSVKLSTDIQCIYKFKETEYNEDYKKINDRLNELNNLQEKNYSEEELKKLISEQTDLEEKLKSMTSSLEAYKSLIGSNASTSPDIDKYKAEFDKQKATIKVYYENNPDYDELDLTNLNDTKVSGSCKVTNNSSYPDKTCTFHFEKEMGLPEACLNMQDASQDDCVLDSSQLNGGNKFYVDLENSGGSVSVIVPDAGYRHNSNFVLDKDENGDPACRFNNSNNKLDFRQIELEDPFLKKYDPKRGVGVNYLNNKFDFENIIHEDTWSTDNQPEYYYLMSKTNVANIKKDTQEDYSGSYLGRNCYFNSTNKYICQFTRNENDNRTDNGTIWFYKFKAYEGMN